MIKKITALVSFSLITHALLAQGNFIKDSLDTYIKREMTRWNLPGMAIAIVKDGKVIFMKGYGVADVAKKTPVTEHTVFQIASNTKAFTGTSLALLEHYGKIDLNDKVKTYLPYFKMNEQWRTDQVSIADVLSHRIGYETFQTDLINWGSTKTRKELIENMVNVTPKFGLREKYGYCNMGFLVAGQIIPAVTDTSWDDYITYHYLIPLQMRQTYTTYSDFMKAENASKAYTSANDAILEITPAKVDNLAPAAGIASTVNDMSKWIMMQLDGGRYNNKQVVPGSVIERTRASFFIENPVSEKGSNFSTYGLGWFLKDEHGKKIVTHDGGANGFLSKVVLIPEDNIGFVILTNSDAQYLYEALGNQLINDLTGQKYMNVSDFYHAYFIQDNIKEKTKTADLKKAAAKFKPLPDAYTKLSGVYTNKVYGKIAIEAKDTYAEVSFEFHPGYKGKISLLSTGSFMLEYNDPTLGVHQLNYLTKEEPNTIDIKVSDFIDQDVYPFTKINTGFSPFVK